MPSAANAKSEKPASSEATDNTPVRQIITIIEHKIRNLEKRKGKLTQYRDWQKAGKELNGDQRVAVAKYDEVAQTLEFARDIAKQIALIATSAERDAKKQAKKDAWVRNATETSKIREVLLILDCLTQMGNNEAREDFLNGTNGAAKLTEDDLKVLDDLYPEVTPKHEPNEEGQPGFHSHVSKAADHLCSIIDGKPKEALGTTYTRIKEIVGAVHTCGYFDQIAVEAVVEVEEAVPVEVDVPEVAAEPEPEPAGVFPAGALPVPPAPGVVPAPAYPLRALPPITLQEVEHAYFAQQYPQQRPIAEVIGSQNFFFLQESEIDSPTGTPQPPALVPQPSPPGPIPSQTFTNQQFMQVVPGRAPEPTVMPMPPQPLFPPHPDHAAFPPGVPLPLPLVHAHAPPAPLPAPLPAAPHAPPQEEGTSSSPADRKADDDWVESRSPERDDGGERKTQGQGDGQGRFRRYGRGGRGAPNGYRGGRGSYQGRQGGDQYRPRPAKDDGYRGKDDGYRGKDDGYRGKDDGYRGKDEGYRGKDEGYRGKDDGYRGKDDGYRGKDDGYRGRDDGYRGKDDGYRGRHDGYQPRHARGADDGYYGNGDSGEHQENGRERYEGGGFKSRGRGGPRARASRPPRERYGAGARHQQNVD